MDEKPNKYQFLPIPTYEEATSSRPPSAQSRIGPEEVSDDAERQGLLGHEGRDTSTSRRNNYVPPTVESERSSIDSLDGLDTHSEDGEVRREMEEMEVDDSGSQPSANRSLLTNRFKRLTSFTSSLSLIRLPSFRFSIPSMRWPKINWEAAVSNRVVIFGRLFGIVLILGLVYILVAGNILANGRGRMGGQPMYDPESIRSFIRGQFSDPTHVGRHLRHLTKYPHMAGSEGAYVLGEYIAEIFKESRLENVQMERFDVYLNYPNKDGRKVSIVEPENLKWEAQIEEDHEETPVFHGHSRSGDVTGPLIYANYGSREDFQELEDKGISVAGAIVLVRYYGTQPDRALKVKAAEEAGAIGCIIFSDPINEGLGQDPNESDARFLPKDGVQRGAVSLNSRVLGDVLTPGWASTPGQKKQRLQPVESPGLVQIPSIPLSWQDAQHLLDALKGHGKSLDGDWAGVAGTEYWTGDQNSPKVNVKNVQDEVIRQPIYNVLGRITGWEQPDKKIIIGNHRDAWCLGGADPGSGTAVMLHMIHIFGELLNMGWRPLRTIEFASWDGTEYNLIGSTEHVENREDELRRNGIAYLNVDAGVTGGDFNAAASPILERPLRHALGRVTDGYSNKTVGQIWNEKGIRTTTLGAGSDYAAFQNIVGTSSIDLSFTGKPYPYHSCYETYSWMERYGDPTWEYSAALGQIWAMLALDLSDNPLLPLDVDSYASSLDRYLDDLVSDIRKHLTEGNPLGADVMATPTGTIDFLPIRGAIQTLKSRVKDLELFDEHWMSVVYGSGGYESSFVTVKRIDRNNRIAKFESTLLDLSADGGLVNRTQFKHAIFAPQAWNGYQGETFPTIRQWLQSEDWVRMQQEVSKVAGMLELAALELIV